MILLWESQVFAGLITLAAAGIGGIVTLVYRQNTVMAQLKEKVAALEKKQEEDRARHDKLEREVDVFEQSIYSKLDALHSIVNEWNKAHAVQLAKIEGFIEGLKDKK
jgi:septal ring factor EnvC (AmiA/AmiB activator)